MYHDKEWCHVSDSVCLKREEGTEETRDNYKQCKQGTLQCISKISRVHNNVCDSWHLDMKIFMSSVQTI